MNRRDFLFGAAAPLLNAEARPRPVLAIFSKHMAQFNYDELGRKAREIGFAGVDLTVRPKGHVLPDRVREDLPRAYEAIRGHGLSTPMITTGIVTAADPAARPTLETAAKLKIPFWKPGYAHYDLQKLEASIEQAQRDAAGLAKLSAEYAVAAGFHNHSGNYVGAALWDTRQFLRTVDPKWAGYYLDPAHAAIEGGLGGWRIALAMALPRLKMVALKDFYWARKGGEWDVRWCPMGQGMVNWREVFRAFAAARFAGPMTLHVEYDPADELAAIANDFDFIRRQVDIAYGA